MATPSRNSRMWANVDTVPILLAPAAGGLVSCCRIRRATRRRASGRGGTFRGFPALRCETAARFMPSRAATGVSISVLESLPLIWKAIRISSSRSICRSQARLRLLTLSHQTSVWMPNGGPSRSKALNCWAGLSVAPEAGKAEIVVGAAEVARAAAGHRRTRTPAETRHRSWLAAGRARPRALRPWRPAPPAGQADGPSDDFVQLGLGIRGRRAGGAPVEPIERGGRGGIGRRELRGQGDQGRGQDAEGASSFCPTSSRLPPL